MTAPATIVDTQHTTTAGKTNRAPGRYMPGLDVVRGVAIAMVLAFHTLSRFASDDEANFTPAQNRFLHLFDVGAMGVHLFFVLSGFLITGILLDSRHKASFYKPFYVRRILRIVPAYLLMIVVLRVTGTISWAFTAVSLLYLCNLPAIFHSTMEYGSFWSLSVEEQFYLVWPFLVRKLSIRSLVTLCAVIVLGSSFLRYVLLSGPAILTDIHYKTWVVGDFFAAGALLSILVRSNHFASAMRPIAAICTAAGLALVALAASLPRAAPGHLANLQAAVFLSPWVIFFSGIVLAAYLLPGMASYNLAKPLIFLGNISYGLYLVHSYIFKVAEHLWPLEQSAYAGWPLFGRMLTRIVLETAVAILIAWVSRRTFEEYFLRKKPKEPKTVEDLSLSE